MTLHVYARPVNIVPTPIMARLLPGILSSVYRACLMMKNILPPLIMAQSTSRQPVPAAFAADLSEGYEFIDLFIGQLLR